jgi:hypothetical protein
LLLRREGGNEVDRIIVDVQIFRRDICIFLHFRKLVFGNVILQHTDEEIDGQLHYHVQKDALPGYSYLHFFRHQLILSIALLLARVNWEGSGNQYFCAFMIARGQIVEDD